MLCTVHTYIHIVLADRSHFITPFRSVVVVVVFSVSGMYQYVAEIVLILLAFQ